MNNESVLLDKLQSLGYIREQAKRVLKAVRENLSNHFQFYPQQLEPLRDFVVSVIKANYPDLSVPYHSRWRHFEVGGVDRIANLKTKLFNLSPTEQGKLYFELVILSVLLDAGAGDRWSYYDQETQTRYGRSEGLAIACLDWYLSGMFSSRTDAPFRVDAQALMAISKKDIKDAFQVNKNNPLEGVEGRLGLLNRLGKVLLEKPDYFGKEGRLGNIYIDILQCRNGNSLSAEVLFNHLLSGLNTVWPTRLEIAGVALGDVWECPILGLTKASSTLIPFHKLTQWLCYSLLEPLEWSSLTITDMNSLTGLPEYRNGGLLIDMGVLALKNAELMSVPHYPSSELIVEWRALTVAILDELADSICGALTCSSKDFPLAKVLQGGTWAAGRQIAKEKRADGGPPLSIISDGTVF